MKPEKPSNRLSSSSLFCFGGPRVNDSDGREMPSCSACFFVARGKKRKQKVPAHSPARSRPVRAGEESRPKKSSAQVRDDNNNGDKNGDRKQPSGSSEASTVGANRNTEQLNLFQTQIKDDIRVIQALPTQHSLPIQKRSNSNEPKPQKVVSRSGKLGPSTGVGIMAITLAIMTFLGRGVAIIWLCSCLYVWQLARASSQPRDDGEKNTSKMIDMDSAEYKKRIILEGFLERNSRKQSNVV
ncbi:uncharacterized protein LOC141812792 [Curcuma longa]|uniref:uncharacterized protein LOC141812792 n=1 Tax=Curcuma longa TaxID=136217 RepID=UPI003D9EDABB